MENYDIKVTGTKQAFEGGAVRYSKEGKGRFDLIPGLLPHVLFETIKDWSDVPMITDMDILKKAYARNFSECILYMIIRKANKNTPITRLDAVYGGCPKILRPAFLETMRELAVHYQKGAEIYGVDNWKKGIPLDSFIDSGLRHLNQWLLGENDENHYISAIWNFAGAIWTLGQDMEDCKRVLTPEDIS